MKALLSTLALALATTALAQNAKPLVIAHRGASGYLPEHTLEAKAYAHALGADYLEQDLVLSKEGVPVVLHDIHLDTTTDVATRFPDRKRADGRYYALDFTVAELKQLKAYERFNAKTGKAMFPKRYDSKASPSTFVISTFEEELQLIQGMNRSTGRTAGIYPELKQPQWHHENGVDLSRAVLPILAKYGYTTKADLCFLQCFEIGEVRRLRNELGWKGRLIMLISGSAKEKDGVDHDALCTPAGIKELATLVDGIGPPVSRIVSWPSKGAEPKYTQLVTLAHAAKLAVHPYTMRRDELPKNCASTDALHAALYGHERIDGLFTDFTDVTIAWLRQNPVGATRPQ